MSSTIKEQIEALNKARAYVLTTVYYGDVNNVEILKLDHAIATLERSKWISVEERLPDGQEEVLCLTRGSRRQVQNSWMAHTDQDSNWFAATFSHWKPLDLPPDKQ